jgi:hypothetical protein
MIDRRVDLEVQEEMKKIELGVDTTDDEEEKAGMTIDLSKMGMKSKK